MAINDMPSESDALPMARRQCQDHIVSIRTTFLRRTHQHHHHGGEPRSGTTAELSRPPRRTTQNNPVAWVHSPYTVDYPVFANYGTVRDELGRWLRNSKDCLRSMGGPGVAASTLVGRSASGFGDRVDPVDPQLDALGVCLDYLERISNTIDAVGPSAAASTASGSIAFPAPPPSPVVRPSHCMFETWQPDPTTKAPPPPTSLTPQHLVEATPASSSTPVPPQQQSNSTLVFSNSSSINSSSNHHQSPRDQCVVDFFTLDDFLHFTGVLNKRDALIRRVFANLVERSSQVCSVMAHIQRDVSHMMSMIIASSLSALQNNWRSGQTHKWPNSSQVGIAAAASVAFLNEMMFVIIMLAA